MPEAATRSVISRRTALRAMCSAALVVVAGCRPSGHSADPTGDGTSSGVGTAAANGRGPSASEVTAHRIGEDEKALLAAYDDAMTANPELAALLGPLRADHVKHLLALVPGAPTSGAPTSSTPSLKPSVPPAPPSSASTSTALASPSASPVLDRLGSLEHNAAAARVDDVMSSSGSLARLVASIGGCEAAHAALLQGAAR